MSDDIAEGRVIQVGSFLDTVGQIVKVHQNAKDLYLDRLAPDYNVFDFIQPDEMRLSSILAWLLNPDGSHGQGSCFLRRFLDALRVDTKTEDCDHAEVRTEVSIKEGRLDILVKTTRFQLAIENKPWAGDRDGQLRRYFAHFDTLGATKYQVIYLTPNGKTPHEDSIPEQDLNRRIAAGQLQIWRYDNEVLAWLMKCRAECRADRVLMFIDEFSRYIRAVFEGVKDRSMSDHLINEIVGLDKNVASAMQVIVLADKIRERLFSDLQQQILRKLPGRDVEIYNKPREPYFGLQIAYPKPSRYLFAMEFQNKQFVRLVIGVSRDAQNGPVCADDYDALISSFGAASQTDWWLWCRPASPTDSLLPVPQDWQTSTQPWIDIANGKLASRIAEAFLRTQDVLNECEAG